MKRTQRTDAEKKGIVDAVNGWKQKGLSQVEACKRVGVHNSQYFAWRKKFNGDVPPPAPNLTHNMTPAVVPQTQYTKFPAVQKAIDDAVNAFVNELDSTVEQSMNEAVAKLRSRYG